MTNPLLDKMLRFYKGKIILFDFETESLNLRFSRPFQISYLRLNSGNIIDKHISFIKIHDLKISPDAARITKFDQKKYEENAVDAKTVLEEFDSYLYDPEYCVLFYNGINFDIYQHAVLREYCGKKIDWSYLNRCVDVHCLFKSIVFNVVPDKLNFLAWQFRLSSKFKKGTKTSLSAMCKYFSIDVDENRTHDALYDNELTLQCFDKIKYQIDL